MTPRDRPVQLGELLRLALNAEPETLVGPDERGTMMPGHPTLVDGQFDLSRVAARFIASARAEGLL